MLDSDEWEDATVARPPQPKSTMVEGRNALHFSLVAWTLDNHPPKRRGVLAVNFFALGRLRLVELELFSA